MNNLPRLIRNLNAQKIRLWLCGLGIMLCMSILASVTPLAGKSISGAKIPANQPAKSLGTNNHSLDPYVIQGASVSSAAAVTPARRGQPVAPPTIPLPISQLCNPYTRQPLPGCGLVNCPEVADRCNGCGGVPGYACAIE
jgi:hypothetical protein